MFYTVEYKPAGGAWTVLSLRQTALTYVHAGLQPGSTAEYIVDPSVKVKDKEEYVLGIPWYGEVTTSDSAGSSSE